MVQRCESGAFVRRTASQTDAGRQAETSRVSRTRAGSVGQSTLKLRPETQTRNPALDELIPACESVGHSASLWLHRRPLQGVLCVLSAGSSSSLPASVFRWRLPLSNLILPLLTRPGRSRRVRFPLAI